MCEVVDALSRQLLIINDITLLQVTRVGFRQEEEEELIGLNSLIFVRHHHLLVISRLGQPVIQWIK